MNLELLKLCYIEAITNEASPEEFVELVEYEMTARNISKFNPDPIVSDIWGIEVEELKQKTRKRDVVNARQVCMWLRIRNTKDSLSMIGRCYNKDHATVLHARKVVDDLIETDKVFRERVEMAKSSLEKKMLLYQNSRK